MKLSAAQRKGLRAFNDHGRARRSNRTSLERHTVHVDTMQGLARHGMCVLVANSYDLFELTPAGAAAVLTLEVPA